MRSTPASRRHKPTNVSHVSGASPTAVVTAHATFAASCASANHSTAPVIREHAASPRLMVAQPNYDRVTEQRKHDVDLRALSAALPIGVRTENIPACLGGRVPEAPGAVLDGAMLGADARLDMGRYANRYIADRYYTKSLRCKTCVHDATCQGVHINYVRAHRYAALVPVLDVTSARSEVQGAAKGAAAE